VIQNPNDLPLYEPLGMEAEREAIEATDPALVYSRTETFKALLREGASPRWRSPSETQTQCSGRTGTFDHRGAGRD
jgi:hypothetical protein